MKICLLKLGRQLGKLSNDPPRGDLVGNLYDYLGEEEIPPHFPPHLPILEIRFEKGSYGPEPHTQRANP
jgi:hypothetical protein